MAKKGKEFLSVKFPHEVIQEAVKKFSALTCEKKPTFSITRNIKHGSERIEVEYDTDEEFYSIYSGYVAKAWLYYIERKKNWSLSLWYWGRDTEVEVSLPSLEGIEEVLAIFEERYNEYAVPDSTNISKEKEYSYVKFPPELIKKAFLVFSEVKWGELPRWESKSWSSEKGNEKWVFNNEEEFWSEYREEVDRAEFSYQNSEGELFDFTFTKMGTSLRVSLDSKRNIERVFEVFEEGYSKYRLPEEEAREAIKDRVKIFIGHGRNPLWKELKDHLSDQHGFKIEAYETGPRAGFHIIEVLKEMSDESSFALLVHTGEDEGADGKLHARDNVIHETGLFQGKLGFSKAIVLLEEGCEEFSNINGLQQLRFSKGNIKEIFGDVIATINREFGVD